MIRQKNQQAAFGCLGLFLILAILVKTQFAPLMRLDQRWSTSFSASALGQHVRVWEWLTLFGSPLVMSGLAVVLALFLWRIRQHSWAGVTLLGVIGGDGLLLVVKQLVGRLRPLHQVVADTGFSFPSGHVFGTVLLAAMLITLLHRFLKGNAVFWWVTALIILGVIGVLLARLGLRAHYPSDVLGSVLLANGWWLEMISLREWVVRKRQKNLVKE